MMNKKHAYIVRDIRMVIVVICIIMLCLVYVLWFTGILPTKQARAVARNDYVRKIFRIIDERMIFYYKTNNCFYPCNIYYGTLNQDILGRIPGLTVNDARLNHESGAEYWAIDPFNLAESKDSIMRGPFFSDTRGSPLRIKGHELYYFTDGRTFFIVGSYGPDEDQDLLSEDVIVRKPKESSLKLDIYNFELFIDSKKYDTSNGTISNGDIILLNIDPLKP